MRRFKKYLTQKGHTPRTTKAYTLLLGNFISWCDNNGVNHKKASLEELYDYQSFNRDGGDKPRTMTAKIAILKHYYRSIKRKDNPALLVQTDTIEKKLPKNIMDEDTLMNMYLDYQPELLSHIRNKIMFGLIIFQGVTRSEMEAMELEHIDLDKNRVYVPSTVMTNARYVSLHPVQRKDLVAYLDSARNELLDISNKSTSHLFFSTKKGNYSLTNVHTQMLRKFKKLYPYLVSFNQIRQSKISMWVNELGIRNAQYLSGLRYVSSLLRYKKTDAEKLKQKLGIVHPMERLRLSG